MLGLTAIPAVIELALLPFFPESPRYMLIQKRDEKNSRKGKNTGLYMAALKLNPTVFYMSFVPLSNAAPAWSG